MRPGAPAALCHRTDVAVATVDVCFCTFRTFCSASSTSAYVAEAELRGDSNTWVQDGFIELPRLNQSSVCPHRMVAHEPGSGPYFRCAFQLSISSENTDNGQSFPNDQICSYLGADRTRNGGRVMWTVRVGACGKNRQRSSCVAYRFFCHDVFRCPRVLFGDRHS